MNQNVEPIDIAIKVKDIKFASKVPLNKQQQTRELFRLYLEEKNIWTVYYFVVNKLFHIHWNEI